MKNLLLTTAVFLGVLLMGCQENPLFDPIHDTGLEKDDNILVQTGIIELEGILVVPGAFQSYYSIEGQINYTHELVLLDPQPPAPQYYISLGLNVNADLRDPSSPTDPIWVITDKTEDIIYISEEGIYLIEKYFNVQGSEEGLVLVCRFLVATDGVGLNEMWLVAPEGDPNLVGSLNKSSEIIYPPLPPVQITEFE